MDEEEDGDVLEVEEEGCKGFCADTTVVLIYEELFELLELFELFELFELELPVVEEEEEVEGNKVPDEVVVADVEEEAEDVAIAT